MLNNVNSEINVTYLAVTYNLQLTAVVVLIIGFIVVISLLLCNIFKSKKTLFFSKSQMNLRREYKNINLNLKNNFKLNYFLIHLLE
jgi:hypothetical protein